MKPHIHAAVIHAFADGAEIQVMTSGEWRDCKYPDFEPGCGYRIKPAAPKWPQTTMTGPELGEWFQSTRLTPSQIEVIIDGVNKAMAKECQSGALVPADKVHEIEAKAYEEGVKEGAERGLDKAIRATLNHVNFAVDGIGWMKIRSEAKK